MKCSTLASVTSILSIFRPALALDGYTCVGQNIGHSFLMGEINAHYNEFLQKSPSDPFFTIDGAATTFYVPYTFGTYRDDNSRLMITYYKTKKIHSVIAIVFELVRKCEAVSIWQRIF
ncbi:Bgt_avrF2_16 [Blumeria graminis f. sp. tritici]|uniref:Bgt_avrF2_16 n=1 Tax=Blumeria graminis f. sp. tritici TaxID=62690 RepID=A0A9X9MPT1_BLUGR|nr:Bgt_avrF2_16 [Blumeria graminis f. sp. tritici]